MNEHAAKLQTCKAQLDEVNREIAAVAQSNTDLNLRLLDARKETERVPLKRQKLQNSAKLTALQARKNLFKTEMHYLTELTGTAFERAFIKVAKANLATRTYQKLVDQATTLAGLPNKKKEREPVKKKRSTPAQK